MTSRSPWNPRWLLPAAVGLVAVPLLVAAIAQRDAHWTPVFDLAMTELRVRDVGGRHTPLIGLQGRIGPTGSHPGPLSFYLLAPVYRLLGSSAFALQVSTAVLHAAAATTALVVVGRRRDGRAVLAVAVVLLLLILGYGLGALTEPWNPQLPVLWFVAFLVAAWAVVDGDLPMLLPAVLAASICAQTHVPYLAVTLGVGLGVTVGAAFWARRQDGTEGAEPRQGGWRWLGAAAALGVLLWVPPLIDEVVHEPGNLTQLVDHLATPDDEPIGVRRASTFVLERMDAWQLAVVEPAHPGTYVRVLTGPGPERSRGIATVAVWAVCVVATALLRNRALLALHAVVGGAALVAVAAISRIYGVPWPYLMFWAFGIGAMMLLAIVATAVVAARRWWPPLASERSVALTGWVGLVVAAALCGRLLAIAPDTTTETPEQTEQVGRLVPPTAAALDAGVGAASGHDGRYNVHWDDAANGPSEGIGLVNELVRRGFDVGVAAQAGVQIGLHRVRPDGEATARVVLASGGRIDRWAAEPGATRIAYDDPRTPSERAEYAEVRAAALDALRTAGRTDLLERIDTDLLDVALNEGLGLDVGLLLGRMLELGVPVAVFVLPPAVAS